LPRITTGGNKPSYIDNLSINVASAALDLNDSHLVVNNSTFTDMQNLVFSGFRNAPDPAATGITSTTAQNDGGKEILALLDNALIGTPDWPPGSGNTVAANAIIGKYTYFGDVNIDGQVTGDDYGTIDANLNTTPAPGLAWIQGDANLDGIVTGDDYGTIDATLGNGVGNPLVSAGAATVPEPGIGLLWGAATIAARRR